MPGFYLPLSPIPHSGAASTLKWLAAACEASVEALAAAAPHTAVCVLACSCGLAAQKRAEGSSQLDRRLVVSEIPHKGRGYVASDPICAGERILVERPLVFRSGGETKSRGEGEGGDATATGALSALQHP